ncbi:MAG: SRPBCC family protein [Arthrobacter sp.]|nr:SRPBCC family protein [Arthrobacter sp.]
MTPRLFDLRSTWHLPAPVEKVWGVLTSLDLRPGEPVWWPGCTVAAPLTVDPSSAHPGEQELTEVTAHLRFRTALGYSLTVSIHPTVAAPPRTLEFEAQGDLDGEGAITLTPDSRGHMTRMDIRWTVRPTVRWMNLLVPVAAPVFVAAHAHTMRKGERGLAAALTSG